MSSFYLASASKPGNHTAKCNAAGKKPDLKGCQCLYLEIQFRAEFIVKRLSTYHDLKKEKKISMRAAQNTITMQRRKWGNGY